MKFEKKQLTLLSITIAAFAFLGWEVYQLVSSDITAKPPTTLHAAEPMQKATTLNAPQLSAPLANNINQHETSLTLNSKAYINLLNKYKTAKLQHKVLSEEVAIAKARNEIAVVNQKTQSMSGTNSLNPDNFGTTTSSTNKNATYTLAYLDNQNGTWTATLSVGGAYQQVNSHTQLIDGTRILSIDRGGVLLQSGKERYYLTFDGITQLSPNATAPASERQQNAAASTQVILKPSITANTTPKKPTNTQPTYPAQKNIKTIEAKIVTDHTVNKKAAVNIKKTAIKKPKPSERHVRQQHKKFIRNSENKKLNSQKVIAQRTVGIKKANHHNNSIAKKVIAQQTKNASHHNNNIAKRVIAQQTIQTKKASHHNNSITQKLIAAKKPTAAKTEHQTGINSKKLIAENTLEPKITINKDNSVSYSLDESILLEMPATSFTIKLKQSKSKMTLLDFAKHHHILDKALCYASPQGKKHLFTLVYGNYMSTRDAEIALAALPRNLQKENLSIQRISEVQHAIKLKTNA